MISWSDDAWDDYMYWHDQDQKKIIKKINKLIGTVPCQVDTLNNEN